MRCRHLENNVDKFAQIYLDSFQKESGLWDKGLQLGAKYAPKAINAVKGFGQKIVAPGMPAIQGAKAQLAGKNYMLAGQAAREAGKKILFGSPLRAGLTAGGLGLAAGMAAGGGGAGDQNPTLMPQQGGGYYYYGSDVKQDPYQQMGDALHGVSNMNPNTHLPPNYYQRAYA
jgi:hypothetical protein